MSCKPCRVWNPFHGDCGRILLWGMLPEQEVKGISLFAPHSPAPVHNILLVFSLAVFSSLPAPTEQLQLLKLQLLHPSDPCKGNVYTAIFQGWWDVLQLFVQLSGWLSRLHLLRGKQRQHRAGLE